MFQSRFFSCFFVQAFAAFVHTFALFLHIFAALCYAISSNLRALHSSRRFRSTESFLRPSVGSLPTTSTLSVFCGWGQNRRNETKKKMQFKPSVYQYRSAECVTTLTPPTYQTCSLQVTLLTFVMGYLILRCASRLDAFSVYHFHTRLPGYAPGGTTDAPAVCPSRSSRTKDSSSQISCAHDRQGPNCLTTF